MRKATASIRYVIIRWQMLWQLWIGSAVALFAWHRSDSLPITWVEVGYAMLTIVASALLLALLALLLKPEPLAICFNYKAGHVTCYRPGLPWRIRLPFSQVYGCLSEQVSHSGRTHFLLVSGPHGQAWAMQESNGWPLARLEMLHELLTADVHSQNKKPAN
jgi:hypothetical protein